MIELSKGTTRLVMVRPDVKEPYYRGTRFDKSGIILTLEHGGRRYISKWFHEYDPYKHDAVCGPAEEFTPIGYDSKSEDAGFLKTGVGILERDGDEYDQFHLYKTLDGGEWELESVPDHAEFTHRLSAGGYAYCYHKKISIQEEGLLTLEHRLENKGGKVLDMYVYNHNFFVLDGATTGKDTVVTLPFKPEGHWREDYDCVRLTDNGICFDRDLNPGERVFMGDLNGHRPQDNYSFRIANMANGLTVDVRSDATMEYAVFWSIHEVACLEPYTRLSIEPGHDAQWKIEYRFGVM